MEKQQQIKLFFLSCLFLSFKLFSQEKNLKLVINDSIKFQSNLLEIKNAFLYVDDNKIIDLSYWPSKDIGCVLIRRKENLYLKLGFNYVGGLINQSEYVLLDNILVAQGTHYFYDDNGNLSHLYTYQKGKLSGKYIAYYENGMLKVSGNYIEDEKKGNWIYYSRTGKVTRVQKYK